MSNDEIRTKHKPMRVVMLGIHDRMMSVYLPETRKGKYYFACQNGKGCDVPVYVVDEDDQWVLRGTDDVCLYRDEQDIGARAVLSRDYLLGVKYGGKAYIVYTEEEDENDAMFLPYVLPTDKEITIGREDDNSIIYFNNYVSRYHAKLWWEDAQLHIRDERATNGVFVNGRHVQECELRVGDVVFIMGLYIVIGTGFVCMNNGNRRVVIADADIHEAELTDSLPFAAESPADQSTFDRLPRRKFQLEADPIEVSGPPPAAGNARSSLLMRLATPAISGSRSLLTGNYMMALTSMMLPIMNQGLSDKEKEKYDEMRLERYREYLQQKRTELFAERDRECSVLNELYPPLNEVLDFSTVTTRLWERRYVDDDFLNIRIGTGKRKLKAEIHYPREHFELIPDMLEQEMQEVVNADYDVYRAPICLSLREYPITGLVGSTPFVQRMCANMILYLCFTHSYDELKIIILGGEQDTQYIQEEMASFRYLPHCWDNLRTIRFIAQDKADACVIGEYLKKKLEDRFDEKGKVKSGTAKPNPVYVIFSLNKELLDCIELVKNIITAKEYAGLSVVTACESALKESSCLIRMQRNQGTLMDLQKDKDSDVTFFAELCDAHKERESLQALMSTRLKTESAAFNLPKTYTFLEMFNAGRVEYLNPLMRWKNSNPTKSLATPIGVGTDGNLFYLDLHQKRQGPHGLVAGMTGSGKSEFIITYILSLAVNFSPDEVAFVLIDYKGGGLTTAFDDPARGIHLPHVVGTITNLDGAAINRALTSIQSELKRRQAVFNEAKSLNNEGTMDIYDYQKLYRAGKVRDPLPHLFLISDEFAELKKQQPEFMDALISTARIGRSLGVHLILATQKPSGVVNDQIWSNSKFRVCLKVQDRSDSNEMLKRPEAAELRDTGRFYLQVGYNEYFALGQSAWCGADYIPQDEVVTQKDESVDFLDITGQVILNAKKKINGTKSDMKQLVAIVQYLSDLAKEQHITPKRLWLDPLPEKLDYAVAATLAPAIPAGSVCAFIGIADDPEKQRRLPFGIRLEEFRHMYLCGNSGSGKSTFLRTMLYSLVKNYSPEDVWYYIVDLSGGAMNQFRNMPHCGAYLTDSDEVDFNRLITMVRTIAKERKALFKEADVTSFEAYREYRRLPYILIVIDSYTNITNFSNGTNFNASVMHELLRDTAPLGIHFVISTNHPGELASKARQEVDYRVALQAKDRYEYADIMDTKINVTPTPMSGTGLCKLGDQLLEYHVAVPDVELGDRERNMELRNQLREIAAGYSAELQARPLPYVDKRLIYPDLCKRFKPGRIPLGIHVKTCDDVAIPLKQLDATGIFFGNPDGITPVLDNLLYAARMNSMRVIVLTSTSKSRFAAGSKLSSKYADVLTLIPCTVENIVQLAIDFSENVHPPRFQLRNRYCLMHDLPVNERSSTLKAHSFVCEHSQPIMYLFESMREACQCVKDLTEPTPTAENGETAPADSTPDAEEQERKINAVLRLIGTIPLCKGYNYYFTGLFYADEDLSAYSPSELLKNFISAQFHLLFGGKYDKTMVAQLPNEIRQMTKPLQDPSHCIMKYRDEFHTLHMPLFELPEEQAVDPDDLPIV